MYRPEIVQVIPTPDYTVYLYYGDGSVRAYDAKPLLQKGGVFEKLKDAEVFLKACTIMNGTLAWDVAGNYNEWECIDICPDILLESPLVENIDEVEKKLFASSQ